MHFALLWGFSQPTGHRESGYFSPWIKQSSRGIEVRNASSCIFIYNEVLNQAQGSFYLCLTSIP